MGRLHLFEIQDQPWCPRRWRDCMTELMRFSIDVLAVYDPILPKLRLLMERAGSHRIVDLCSGGAGPWRRLGRALEHETQSKVHVLLTDKYPNVASFERTRANSGGTVDFTAESVDATDVPPALEGARTLFSSFHHFRPEAARQILRDAAVKGAPIGVFEFTERSVFACVSMLFTPLVTLLVVPFLLPFSIWRGLSCLPLPFVPLIATWDGMVSNFRTYSPRELELLVADLHVPGYTWETGRISGRGKLAVTYLLGLPDAPRARRLTPAAEPTMNEMRPSTGPLWSATTGSMRR